MEKKDTVPLMTPDGPVRGYREENEFGTQYYYTGIPYAKPPLGPLRFRQPFPILPWATELDCTKEPKHCWHITKNTNDSTDLFRGTEDCLYMSVCTPSNTPENLLPVMFWIGNYVYSRSLDHIINPSTLTNAGVVFVQCGSRLGPFGFLSVLEPAAPGNAGLKDIVMALKWVQRNISVFGGDPNNVTIFGNSSGAAMVHLLVLSPMATGLFHKAIVQSGCALNNWALDRNPLMTTNLFAKELNIEAKCYLDILEMLKTLPAETIMEVFFKMMESKKDNDKLIFEGIFKPVLEIEFEGQQAFITKSPYLIIKNGTFNKVPIIFGSVNIEASLLLYIREDFFSNYDEFNKDASILVPRALSNECFKSKNIGEEIIKFYMDDVVTEGKKHLYLQLVSDYYFIYYLNKCVGLHKWVSPEVPVYYYIFNFAGDWIVPEEMSLINSTGHSSDIPYIFQLTTDGEACKGGRDSLKTRKRVVKMWTNFAKFSNPTPDEDPLLQVTWDPVESKDSLHYLSISSELTKGRNPFYERIKFWDHLHEKYDFLRFMAYCTEMGISLGDA